MVGEGRMCDIRAAHGSRRPVRIFSRRNDRTHHQRHRRFGAVAQTTALLHRLRLRDSGRSSACWTVSPRAVRYHVCR